jgi:hypothetical protein
MKGLRKTLEIVLLSSFLSGCATVKQYDNYQNPMEFYRLYNKTQIETSDSDLIATLGSVLSVIGGTENERAAGAALGTFGALQSNKEAAEIGRPEINITIPEQSTALPDRTYVPEYNLEELKEKYTRGHLVLRESTDIFETVTNIYEIDGLQCIFTCERSMDLDYNGLGFDELINIKRNFIQGENLEVCVGYRSSAIEVTKEKRDVMFDKKGPEKTTTRIELRLLDESNNLIKTFSGETDILEYHQEKIFREEIDTSELKPGLYTIEAEYSNSYDLTRDERFFWDYEEEMIINSPITKLRQYFQILPKE